MTGEAQKMGMTLDEYAAQHPMQEPEAPAAPINYRDRQADRAEAARLMDLITRQLQEGQAPQYVLATALKAIGLLSDCPEWTEDAQILLEIDFCNIGQQSLLADHAAQQAERLRHRQADYFKTLERRLSKQLQECRTIENHISQTIAELHEIQKDA